MNSMVGREPNHARRIVRFQMFPVMPRAVPGMMEPYLLPTRKARYVAPPSTLIQAAGTRMGMSRSI